MTLSRLPVWREAVLAHHASEVGLEMAIARTRTNRFWAVADFFRGQTDSRWAPTHAGYESARMVAGGGYPWIVRLKIHVAPASPRPRSGHLFKATVTWWPAQPRPMTDSVVVSKRTGWFARIKRTMLDAGYRGGWSTSPHGTYADFVKDLRTVGEVRRETRLLQNVDVTGMESRVKTRTDRARVTLTAPRRLRRAK